MKPTGYLIVVSGTVKYAKEMPVKPMRHLCVGEFDYEQRIEEYESSLQLLPDMEDQEEILSWFWHWGYNNYKGHIPKDGVYPVPEGVEIIEVRQCRDERHGHPQWIDTDELGYQHSILRSSKYRTIARFSERKEKPDACGLRDGITASPIQDYQFQKVDLTIQPESEKPKGWTLRMLKEAKNKVLEQPEKKEADYWRERCEAAEAYIEESPCDPDIYPKQLEAYHKWKTIKERN